VGFRSRHLLTGILPSVASDRPGVPSPVMVYTKVSHPLRACLLARPFAFDYRGSVQIRIFVALSGDFVTGANPSIR
jgi:hypothetical protein